MSDKYHIIVGEQNRIKTVMVGTIEKGTGSTVIEQRGETLAKRGEVIFPNRCQIWGARVIKGKFNKDDREIDVTDPNYKGEVMGLKWGDPRGMLIDVRYIKGLPSLDVLYQENRLNFKIDENKPASADAYFLQFPNGENDFDESSDALLIQHLKWHSYNPKSISKDPQFFTQMFFEKNFEEEETVNSLLIDVRFESGRILREAVDGADSMAKCKNLFSIVKNVTDEEPEDTKMYSYLKVIADKKPALFLKAIEDYKVKVSTTFEKLKNYEAVDWTKDGTLATTKEKKNEVVISELPTKGEAIFDYLLENFTDPKVYEATYKLIQITDKL